MKQKNDLEILLAAQAGLGARGLDPEKARSTVEEILVILVELLQAFKGNLTLIGLLMRANLVLDAVRRIIAIFKKGE